MVKTFVPVAVGLLFSLLALPVGAQPAEADQYRVRTIERSTLSPFCPGQTLYDCPSPRAAEWRSDIRRWVDEGVSSKEIKGRLQARVPDMNLESDSPGPAPVFAIALVSIVVVLAFAYRARRRAQKSTPIEALSSPPAEEADELDRQIDRELADLERYS